MYKQIIVVVCFAGYAALGSSGSLVVICISSSGLSVSVRRRVGYPLPPGCRGCDIYDLSATSLLAVTLPMVMLDHILGFLLFGE